MSFPDLSGIGPERAANEDTSVITLRKQAPSEPKWGYDEDTLSSSEARPKGISRFSAATLPLVIAASLFAPSGLESIRRRMRTTSLTSAWSLEAYDPLLMSAWALQLEPILEAEVEYLRQIWALPYAGPVDFDFRTYD